MTTVKGRPIEPAEGKLGILLPGMGAVATTFIAGVEAIRRGLAKPIGSLTQMGTVRLGKRTDNRSPLIKEFVPLADLSDIVFGGWDIYPDSAYEAARKAGVLDHEHLDALKDFLSGIKPWPAAFDPQYVKKLHGENVKKGKSKRDLAEQVSADIERFKKEKGLSRLVMVWCGSTEVYRQAGEVHSSLAKFEKGLDESHPDILPFDDLRLLRDQGGHPVRERGPEPVGGFSGDDGAREERRRADRGEGLQDRPDLHEDAPRSGLQGASVWE